MHGKSRASETFMKEWKKDSVYIMQHCVKEGNEEMSYAKALWASGKVHSIDTLSCYVKIVLCSRI